MKELEEAAFQLPIDKTPGKNGLPVEFFTTYWESLKDLYFKYINYIKHHGISNKQNTSITKMIHKKDEKDELTNYRPIALINADLKILTKVLSNRLKQLLSKIIHKSQTCVDKRKIVFYTL